VKLVLFAVEANIAAVALQGTMAKRLLRHLDPKHTPPQNLPFMRLVRLLDLAFHREYQRLIDDNVLWLGARFASTNSDFYQNPERRESYGCIVSNMAARRYNFKDGRRLFVSRQTINEGVGNELAIQEGVLAGMEIVVAFKKFDGAKTGIGVGKWLYEEHVKKGLLPLYVGYHLTDGASNAVSSANHYKLLSEINSDTQIHHQTCLAHQVSIYCVLFVLFFPSKLFTNLPSSPLFLASSYRTIDQPSMHLGPGTSKHAKTSY
jgi:hypothetical protein